MWNHPHHCPQHRENSLLFSVSTARLYASAVYAVVVCSSVHLCVTSRHCTKMAKRRITKAAPHDSLQNFSFFDAPNIGEIPTGSPQLGRQIEVDKFKRRFSTNISPYLRNGARSGHSYYGTLIWSANSLCAPSTGAISSDLESDPNYPKPPYFRHFVSHFISS